MRTVGKDTAGFSDKKNTAFIKVRMSILGCLKVADENEFPTVFTHSTSSGFYDRILFGLTDTPVVWKPWHPGPYESIKFSTPVIPEWVFKDVRDCYGDKGRLAENALRVLYITSAVNGDEQVGMECVLRTVRFIDWQERIRGVFRPAQGAYEHQVCVEAVKDAFRSAAGHAANWRVMARKQHWSRHFPRSLTLVKKLLESTGELTLDKTTNKHYLREEK